MKNFFYIKESSRKGFVSIVKRTIFDNNVTDKVILNSVGKNVLTNRIVSAVKADTTPKSHIRDSKEFGKVICFGPNSSRNLIIAESSLGKQVIDSVIKAIIKR